MHSSMYQNFNTNVPVFVRSFYRPIIWQGKKFHHNEHFPWQEMNMPYETAKTLFYSEQLYHNPELEKQTRVGDQLEALEMPQIEKLVGLLNAEVKERTVSTQEYNKKKLKQSRVRDRQVGLIRSWLRSNEWAHERFHELRDFVTKEKE